MGNFITQKYLLGQAHTWSKYLHINRCHRLEAGVLAPLEQVMVLTT